MATPNDHEQLALEYINLLRTDPDGEYARLVGTDASTDSAISYFGVDLNVLQSQLSALTAADPLAWNTNIATAATAHSQEMIAQDAQQHTLSGEDPLSGRVATAGYTGWTNIGENIYAYSSGDLFGHAGFVVDWGFDGEDYASDGSLRSNWQTLGDGIQDGVGHRNNIMSTTFTEVGISIIEETDLSTAVGRYVVTQDFGRRSAYSAQFLGVVIDDTDNDDFYDIGEGMGGITVTLDDGSATHTTTTWDSGGWQIDVPAGTYTITFSGGALTGTIVKTATIGTANVKVDAEASEAMVVTVADTFVGGAEDDNFAGGDGNDNLSGGGGNDYLYGQDDDDILDGGEGQDRLYGGNGNDLILGGAGNDYISANGGEDSVNGGSGDDKIFGGGGDDRVAGGNGQDFIYTQSGNDTANGGGGVDYLSGGSGDDVLHGGNDADKLLGGGDNDVLYGGGGDDLLSGGYGDDRLWGGAGDDILLGSRGADSLSGQGGADSINGGDGTDWLSGGGGEDVLRGANDDDVLLGHAGHDSLYGDNGADSLNGGGGHDQLNGGAGNDVLTGSVGNDTFQFTNGWGDDTITDFANNGIEKINLAPVSGVTEISDLTISTIGGNAQIAYAGNTIVVEGLVAGDLDSGDFVF